MSLTDKSPSHPFLFPAEKGPPPRRPLLGLFLSIGGAIVLTAGFCGAALEANRLVRSFLHMYLSMTGQASPFSADGWSFVLIFFILAIPVGGLLAMFGMSKAMGPCD